jgi:hypothetical protein
VLLIGPFILEDSMTGQNYLEFLQNELPEQLEQRCPTFLYIGAHLTDGCGGAGAMWKLQ